MASNLKDALIQYAIVKWLTGFLRDKETIAMLTGKKTYITAILLLLVAAYGAVFGDVPGLGHVDLGEAIMGALASLGLIFARNGSATEAKKTLDKLS